MVSLNFTRYCLAVQPAVDGGEGNTEPGGEFFDIGGRRRDIRGEKRAAEHDFHDVQSSTTSVTCLVAQRF